LLLGALTGCGPAVDGTGRPERNDTQSSSSTAFTSQPDRATARGAPTSSSSPALDATEAQQPVHGVDAAQDESESDVADVEAYVQIPVFSVAVVTFENTGTSVELNRLGAAASEMLAHDLSRYPGIHVLERTGAGELLGERELVATGLAQETTGTGRERMPAEYLITGSCAAGNGKLVLGARLTKIGTEQRLGEWTLDGSNDDLFQLEQKLAERITAALGVATKPRRTRPSPHLGETPTVAILPLKNQGPEARLDVMETGFAEILQANLGAIAGMRLVDRTELEKILVEHKLSLSGVVDSRTAVQVGKLLQAERLLLGSFLDLGGNLCIQVRLVDTGSAMLLASEKLVGPRDKFSELLEDLAMKIIADLAVSPPENAAAAVRTALPAHSLESAIHYATANRRLRQGKAREAANAFQQAILMEPENLALAFERMNALALNEDYPELVRTGRQAMSRPGFASETAEVRMGMLSWVAQGLAAQNVYDELLAASNQLLAEFPEKRGDVYFRLAFTLWRLNRFPEALQMADKAIDGGENAFAEHWRSDELRNMYFFYSLFDQRGGKRDPIASKAASAKALQFFDQIVVAARGSRDEAAKDWGHILLESGVDVHYVDDKNQWQRALTPAEQADRQRLALATFGWDPQNASRGTYKLTRYLEQFQQWEPAVAAYREFLANTDGIEHSAIPSLWYFGNSQPNSWIDKRAAALFRIASILQDQLGRRDEAKRAWQEFVRVAGLANNLGSDALAAMRKLDFAPEFPEKSALVLGGDTDVLLAWQKVLAADGFQVHSLRASRICPAHLAPYGLVILARAGCLPYSPIEVLALRHYVGCGGSLLVVVSPGWEPAAPGIHNGLLSFFDMAAGEDPAVRTTATRIVEHPITNGITKVMAKNSMPLTAPAESVVVEAEGRVILAASSYRLGRVAVATLGQWFLPDPSVFCGDESLDDQLEQKHRIRNHRTFTVPKDELPFESGAGLQTELLHNTVRWLTSPPVRGTEFDHWCSELADAQLAVAKVQAGEKSLSPLFDRLIGNAPDAIAREESLWMAAEACQEINNFIDTSWPDAGPKYFARLEAEFPESSLRPYVQWRQAECTRVIEDRRESSRRSSSAAKPIDPIEAFENVSARPNSFASFWARLAIGKLRFLRGQHQEAAELFRPIAEQAPPSPEKQMAVYQLGVCHALLNEAAEARRCFQAVNSMPPIWWRANDDYVTEWGAFDIRGRSRYGQTSQFVSEVLRELNAK
jgi:TolB-like protein